MTSICRHLSVTWEQVNAHTYAKPNFIHEKSSLTLDYTEEHLNAFYAWYDKHAANAGLQEHKVETKVTLWSLPDDLIKLVLTSLTPTTLAQVSRTCARLETMSNSDLVWTPLAMRQNDVDWILGNESSNKNALATKQDSLCNIKPFLFNAKHEIVKIVQRKRKCEEKNVYDDMRDLSVDDDGKEKTRPRPSKRLRTRHSTIGLKANKTMANAKASYMYNFKRGIQVLGFNKMTIRYETLARQMSRLLDLDKTMSNIANDTGTVLYVKAITSIYAQMDAWILKRCFLLGGLLHYMSRDVFHRMLPLLQGLPAHTETISSRKEYHQRVVHIQSQYKKLLRLHTQNTRFKQRMTTSALVQVSSNELVDKRDFDSSFQSHLLKTIAHFTRMVKVAADMANVVLNLENMRTIIKKFKLYPRGKSNCY